jgi:hypothetical protein
MLAGHNNSVATEKSLRYTPRDLATPLLRRKRTLSLTFLFVVPITLLPAHGSVVIVLLAILLGLLISVSLAYLVDVCNPCFHTPVQVVRSLRVPLVVAIPKRPS